MKESSLMQVSAVSGVLVGAAQAAQGARRTHAATINVARRPVACFAAQRSTVGPLPGFLSRNACSLRLPPAPTAVRSRQLRSVRVYAAQESSQRKVCARAAVAPCLLARFASPDSPNLCRSSGERCPLISSRIGLLRCFTALVRTCVGRSTALREPHLRNSFVADKPARVHRKGVGGGRRSAGDRPVGFAAGDARYVHSPCTVTT